MKEGLSIYNPGIGSWSGARDALTGSGFISAFLEGGEAVHENGQLLPLPGLKFSDFFRPHPARGTMKTSTERSKKENGERRSESTGAHVIAPRFLFCNSGKTAFLSTKILFLFSDFIFRGGSVPKSLVKMADNQKTPETLKSPSNSLPPVNGFNSQDATMATSKLAELNETLRDGTRQKPG